MTIFCCQNFLFQQSRRHGNQNQNVSLVVLGTNLVRLTKDQLFFSTEPCTHLIGGHCRPRPTIPNVLPCNDFSCPANPCPEPEHTVCCCLGYECNTYLIPKKVDHTAPPLTSTRRNPTNPTTNG